MKKSIGAKTILYPHPVLVVGTYSEDGTPNVATVSWGGICCSRPPSVAISLREATHTHGNLMRRRAFTVSIPSEFHVREADYFGVASGKDEAKFARSGLTPTPSDRVDAPFVEEFPLVLECNVSAVHELGLHTQFIGEIVDVKADEETLDEKGRPLMERVRPILFSTGNRAYFGIGEKLAPAFTVKEI